MTRPSIRALAALAAVLLSLSCLGPLFAPGGGWVGPAIAAALVAAACGTLGRMLPLSGLSGTILVLAGGLGLLTAVGTPDVAHLGFIPSSSSLSALHDLISSGFSDIRSYSPPVVASPGLVVVLTAGVFAVGVVVDLFAVGADRPALAGVPLLGLVAVPAAFRPHGLGILHLGLALLGWLVLLALEGRDRLVRWGRPLGRKGLSTTPLLIGGAAGRVAGVGLVAAFALPLLVPALHGGIIHPPGQCCSGGSVRVLAPLVTIDQQLHQSTPSQLLTVSTSDPNNPQYLRFTALDDYTGDGFTLRVSNATPGNVNGVLKVQTPGLGPNINTLNVTDTINVFTTLAESYLPLPYSPTDVRVSGNWKLTSDVRTVFSTTDTTAGLNFGVDSVIPDPTKAQLRSTPAGYDPASTPPDVAASLATDLVYPSSIPAVVAQTARRETAGASTAYDKLIALENFFTGSAGGFHYNLTPSPPLPKGAAGLSAFLRYKEGFCQQFATMFTLMARSLNLPARVAVGFTPGKQTADGSFLIDSTDAHAWPEVWFTGVGWVRFEPTPRTGLGSPPAYLSAKAGPNATSVTTPTQAPTDTPTAEAAPAPKHKDPATDTPPPATAPLARKGSSSGFLVVALIVLAVLLLLAVPALLRMRVRRRRVRASLDVSGPDPHHAAHVMWSELLDSAVDVGWVLSPSETPRATGRRLAGLLVSAGAADGPAGSRTPSPQDRAEPSDPQPGSAVDVLERPADILEASRPTAAVVTVERAGMESALAALGRVTEAEERARYAPPTAPVAPASGLIDDVREVRTALLATASSGARLRARLLPASVTERARRSAGSAGNAAARAGSLAGAPARLVGRKLRRGDN